MKVLYLIWFALAAIVHGTIDNLDTAFWVSISAFVVLSLILAGMELAEKENARMREILSAIGIIYESYKTERHG